MGEVKGINQDYFYHLIGKLTVQQDLLHKQVEQLRAQNERQNSEIEELQKRVGDKPKIPKGN